MKKVFITACMAAIACVSLQSTPVVLTGIVKVPPRKSEAPVTPAIPPVADQSSTAVEVVFTSDLGSVNVTVTDSSGEQVYEKTVSAVAGDAATIDTGKLKSGEYKLQLTGEAGSLEGNFSVK